MEYAKIILLAVLGAVLYGIAHDQITARIDFTFAISIFTNIIGATSFCWTIGCCDGESNY